MTESRLFVGCRDSALELLEVQLEGKKRMPAKDFIHGHQPRNGETLGHARLELGGLPSSRRTPAVVVLSYLPRFSDLATVFGLMP